MRRIFAEAARQGLPEPVFSEISTGIRLSIFLKEPVLVNEDTGAQSLNILQQLASGPQSASELLTALGLKSKTGAFKRSIRDLLDSKCIVYTLPDKPDSRLQRYRLTTKGRQIADKLQSYHE